jgi:hypothetical protein
MSTLSEILLVPGNRPKVVADCVRLIEEEVDSKGGLTGLAVKGAFALVKAVKPGFVMEACDSMLDDFVRRLEPFHAAAKNPTLKKAYEKLRPTGKKHVEAAVPRIGRLISKYASAAPTTSAPPPATA